MGKMNELSVLAWNAGFKKAYEEIKDLQSDLAKKMLESKWQNGYCVGEYNLMKLATFFSVQAWPQEELAKLCCLTWEQAMFEVRYGTVLHHVKERNADGSPLRARVMGMCKHWKTRPDDFELPVKYGLKNSFRVTHLNAHEWYVA